MRNIRALLFRYIDIRESEVRIAGILTIIIFGLSKYLNIYETFFSFEDTMENLLLYFIGGFVGLLGVILAGVAVVIGIFTKKEIEVINEVNNKEDFLSTILECYRFCSTNIGLSIVYLSIIYIVISSELPLLEANKFYIIFILTIYIITFNLFYVVSLINECVQLHTTKKIYAEAIANDKNTMDRINEIRTDFILKKLKEGGLLDLDTFKQQLIQYVDDSNMQDKDKVKEYLDEYY